MKKIMVPLTARVHARLLAAARVQGKTPTELAQAAIWDYLAAERARSITAYAIAMGGTDADLDEDLEAAAIELLRSTEE